MPNRTICSVLDGMRDCSKTKNFSYLDGLIEEAQMLANRMEAKLYDLSDYEYKMKEYKKIKAEVDKLREERDTLSKNETSGAY